MRCQFWQLILGLRIRIRRFCPFPFIWLDIFLGLVSFTRLFFFLWMGWWRERSLFFIRTFPLLCRTLQISSIYPPFPRPHTNPRTVLFGPLSEQYGRQSLMLGTLFGFSIFMIGAAVAPNFYGFLIFRFLGGVCASAPITITGAIYADIYSDPVVRGRATALFMVCGVLWRFFGGVKWWMLMIGVGCYLFGTACGSGEWEFLLLSSFQKQMPREI